MKLLSLKFWLFQSIALLFIFKGDSTNAQIIPDGTLPVNSQVTQLGNLNLIQGGTTANTNLFHSFDSFSIPIGSTAFFNNGLNIQNIISRVTGKSISNIDGLIRANGSANLFLINHNGIVFNQNAKLDIGGSFLASTANAIGFGNQGFFSASNPEAPLPLLTINPDALLFNQISEAKIENNSIAPSGLDPSKTFTANGLRVRDGQGLFLVGGNVSINRGGLFAFGGRVELGGLTGVGTVNLNGTDNNLRLSFPDKVEQSDVTLTNGASVNVRSQDGGSIAINARNLELTKQSNLEAGIGEQLGSVNSKAGNIDINAQATVNINDDSLIRNSLQPKATGQSGDINITTNSLFLTNGADLTASTSGIGNAGNISIIAKDSISFDGVGRINPSAAFSVVNLGAIGKGGNINISATSVYLTNGGLASAFSGNGDGGNITVNAADKVFLNGVGINGNGSPFGSGIYTSIVTPEAVGKGGDISITTGFLNVLNGAKLSARTFGIGNAGNITVNARDGVSFDGVGRRGPSSALSSAGLGSVGNGGNVTITTNALTIKNGAELSASSQGRGFAGEIKVNSGTIRLDNKAGILATTASGNGGNITLGIKDLLVLSHNSQISTSAGTAQAGGNGA